MLIPVSGETYIDSIAGAVLLLVLHSEQWSHLLVDVVLPLDGGLALLPVAYAAAHQLAGLAEVALRDEGGEGVFSVAFGYGAGAALADGVGVVVGHGLLLLATSFSPGARRGSPPNS